MMRSAALLVLAGMQDSAAAAAMLLFFANSKDMAPTSRAQKRQRDRTTVMRDVAYDQPDAHTRR